jgi:membrane protease YdiL (CAAX protease family)
MAIPRWLAALQALMVSGIPTQIILTVILWFGLGIIPWGPDGPQQGGLSLEFIATMMLLDTALTALLIRVFLEMSGEDSRIVFLGRRPVFGEIFRGIALIPVMFVGVTVVVLLLRTLAPWLHSVQQSPLLNFMKTPFEAAIFLVVAVLGGGIKEELQRAFVLHRFDEYLGGARLGIVVFSLLFGVLHFDQGWDVALAIGLLGLLWGVLYIKRRSAVMSLVSHAGFNAAQVFQVMLARLLGA